MNLKPFGIQIGNSYRFNNKDLLIASTALEYLWLSSRILWDNFYINSYSFVLLNYFFLFLILFVIKFSEFYSVKTRQ